MIIVMANDPKHRKNALALEISIQPIGDIPSQVPTLFGKADFRVIQDERITFLGHGGKSRFGSDSQAQEEAEGFTPREFVNALMSKGFPGIVKAIDLMGCNIGLIENNSSYVTEVAAILKTNLLTAHIKVYAFTADAELYSRLIVSATTGTGKVFVSGIKKEDENAYREITNTINNENERLKYFDFEVKKLKDTLVNNPIERIQINVNERLVAILQSKTAIEENIFSLKNQRQALRLELYSNSNFRKLLDETLAFHTRSIPPAISDSPSLLLVPSSHTSTASNQDKMEKKSESISTLNLSGQPNIVLNENSSDISSHKKRASSVFDDGIIKNDKLDKLDKLDIQREDVEKIKKSKVDILPFVFTHAEDKGKEKNADPHKNTVEPNASQASGSDINRPSVSRSDLYSHYTEPTLLEMARAHRVNTITTLPTSSLSSSTIEENQTQSSEASHTNESTSESTHRRPR
jgi:hypothetical protein